MCVTERTARKQQCGQHAPVKNFSGLFGTHLPPMEEIILKILLAADAYTTTITNGVTVVLKTLYDSYTAMGHTVRILTMSGDRDSHHEGDVYYIPSFKTPLYPDVRLSLVRHHEYLDELKEWKPDVVHIHTEGPASKLAKRIARSANAPVVMTWHTDYAKFAFHDRSSLKPVEWSVKKLMSVAYKGADMITVPSYKAKALLDGYKLKQPNMVIPNGINLSRFTKELSDEEKSSLLREMNVGENCKVIVIISRLSAEKNIEEIINYFPSVLKEEPDLRLIVAGTGPDKKHLEQTAAKAGIADKVIFPGFVPHDLTYKYYKTGILFLSASTFEMHSLTYLEAMACGLPLICRDDPCLLGVLEDGVNGYIYHDEKEFTEKVIKVVTDDELRRKMSESSLSMSKGFSEQALSERMLELYNELIEKRRAAE